MPYSFSAAAFAASDCGGILNCLRRLRCTHPANPSGSNGPCTTGAGLATADFALLAGLPAAAGVPVVTITGDAFFSGACCAPTRIPASKATPHTAIPIHRIP